MYAPRSAQTNELSPAYDLVPVKIILPQDMEELALTVNGKKARLTRADFMKFAAMLRLNEVQINRTINRIIENIKSTMHECLNDSFLSDAKKMKIHNLMTERLSRLA